MEIVHSFYVMKDILQEIFKNLGHYLPLLFREVGSKLNAIVDQKVEFASSSGTSYKGIKEESPFYRRTTPSLHQGGRLRTDHFHMPSSLAGAKKAQEPMDQTIPQVQTPMDRTEDQHDVAKRDDVQPEKPILEKTKKTRRKAKETLSLIHI